MESLNAATFQIPYVTRQYRQIHILPRIRSAPLIPLVFLCYYGYTITLDQQYITVQNHLQQILIDTRNKQTEKWGFPLLT